MSELPPNPEQPSDPLFYKAPAPSGTPDWIPITALVLGCMNVLSWVIPLCGCPFGIGGIVLGAMGLKSSRYRTLAAVGLVLSILSMVGTIINAAVGAYMGMTGRGPAMFR